MLTRAHWESQSTALPNGRYHVQPRGYWGAIYEVDRRTRDRLVGLQTGLAWAMLALIVGLLPILNYAGTPFLTALAVAIACGGTLSVVQARGIARILADAPHTRAPQLREPVLRVSPMPQAIYRLLMSAYVLLSVLGVLAIGLEILDDKMPPPALLFGCLATVTFAIATWFLRRRMLL